MEEFRKGDTIICERNVKNSAGAYVDPDTSIVITIYNSHNSLEVNAQAMAKDSTGKYHYDFDTSNMDIMGEYRVIYTATNSTRVTSAEYRFILEV